MKLELLFGLVASRVFHHASTMLNGDVTFARIISLFHLQFHDTQTIAEIAGVTGLSQAAASRMVDGLYREGVVDRRESEEDRRQKCVELTPDGLKRIEAMRQVTTDAYAELMAQVPRDLRIRLHEVLIELEPYLIPSEAGREGRPPGSRVPR
ncbi:MULTISPECIES: MarR family winged helix-turn-helix transcriptional regulator [Paraburkholderia]|uniref:MarR family winged helix-turn-helix transcriptional regulator n=1 Tax=Paraburkholderia TaxID=1822464 RepID=UPI00225B96B5|nr:MULTISPECIES: MarR family transcriptional regulator [Paraburkholderia]MCX4162565.1 winged helix DNA-binding protein [Paraburkholderia megapolitana]MDN7158060.1 winged helix DNA-binding protein [Paraburkholderia sp. CHISQ3]MDQ6495107.1 winged helix DNA-binding protein [Paraburkholderia megapolitana]